MSDITSPCSPTRRRKRVGTTVSWPQRSACGNGWDGGGERKEERDFSRIDDAWATTASYYSAHTVPILAARFPLCALLLGRRRKNARARAREFLKRIALSESSSSPIAGLSRTRRETYLTIDRGKQSRTSVTRAGWGEEGDALYVCVYFEELLLIIKFRYWRENRKTIEMDNLSHIL